MNLTEHRIAAYRRAHRITVEARAVLADLSLRDFPIPMLFTSVVTKEGPALQVHWRVQDSTTQGLKVQMFRACCRIDRLPTDPAFEFMVVDKMRRLLHHVMAYEIDEFFRHKGQLVHDPQPPEDPFLLGDRGLPIIKYVDFDLWGILDSERRSYIENATTRKEAEDKLQDHLFELGVIDDRLWRGVSSKDASSR